MLPSEQHNVHIHTAAPFGARLLYSDSLLYVGTPNIPQSSCLCSYTTHTHVDMTL